MGIKTFDEAHKAIMDKNEERFGGISLLDNNTLIAVAKGEIDLNQIAKALLAARGFVADGSGNTSNWVGFEKAKSFWRNY